MTSFVTSSLVLVYGVTKVSCHVTQTVENRTSAGFWQFNKFHYTFYDDGCLFKIVFF